MLCIEITHIHRFQTNKKKKHPRSSTPIVYHRYRYEQCYYNNPSHVCLTAALHNKFGIKIFSKKKKEPCREKTNILHIRKQGGRSAAKLISAFVFATPTVQFLYFLNPKYPASIHLLCLYSSICVRPVWKPHCMFFHVTAH